MARDRSSGRKLASMIARLPGVMSAAPMPCSRRAAISNSVLGAAAQSPEAIVNHAAPITKMRRRP